VVRAEQHPQHVRDDETHEADQAGHRHGKTGEQRPQHERPALHAFDVHTDLHRSLLAKTEGVVIACHHEQGDDDESEHRCEQTESGRLVRRDLTHQVEDDLVELLERRQTLDEVDQGGAEGVEDGPGQQDRINRQTAADRGDPLDQHQRAERPGERRRGDPQSAEQRVSPTQAEQQRQHTSDAGPARDAEDVGVGQWIAQQRLKDDTGDGQGAAEQRSEQHTWQAEAEQDLPVHVAQCPPVQEQLEE
jgi:hypothetical protein